MSEDSVFTWTFEPKNLFRLGEGLIECELGAYRLIIRDGQVEAVVPDLRTIEGWPNVHDIKKELRHGVERFLDSRAIWTHETYQLSYEREAIPEASEDELDHVLRVTATAKAKIQGHAEIQVRGPDGDLIGDSRDVRKRQSKEFGRLTHRYYERDRTAYFIIRRYRAAIEDPDNEFIHLFDILEALKDRFDERSSDIRQRLGIEKDKFKTFCILANNPDEKPVRQGRHRGRNIEELRDASEAELSVARQVARELVFGYLQFLDEQES